MNKLIHAAFVSIVVAGGALAGPVQNITLTVDNPIVYVSPGGTISFTGYFSNNDTNNSDLGIFINSDDPNSFLPADATFTDNLLNNAPLSAISPNTANTGDIDLFDVTIAADDAPGTYQIDDTVFGGTTTDASDQLLETTFTVVVTPEPSTIALMAAAGLMIGGFYFRRARKA